MEIFLSLQVVVKAFQTLCTSTTGTAIVSLIRHLLVTGQLDPPSKFKYAKLCRNCLEDLKSLNDLYQDYWGMGERKTTGVLLIQQHHMLDGSIVQCYHTTSIHFIKWL